MGFVAHSVKSSAAFESLQTTTRKQQIRCGAELLCLIHQAMESAPSASTWFERVVIAIQAKVLHYAAAIVAVRYRIRVRAPILRPLTAYSVEKLE